MAHTTFELAQRENKVSDAVVLCDAFKSNKLVNKQGSLNLSCTSELPRGPPSKALYPSRERESATLSANPLKGTSHVSGDWAAAAVAPLHVNADYT
ncbi:hypothetical protein DAPPUDRAFT_236933 [Daphnia pulex]|uniref:Uncharacterized protein n=1 Tax=Daphnia pulex TaxID=6669 RepID=E9G2B2_DAPPU|nr:hypothetical protein DAPPUDRAFT_236933 [Daphnia pulex]|eukprot:EFX86335.1 hypothetical protein DAPPUDRAFT_236933 [Daphnia pulex]